MSVKLLTEHYLEFISLKGGFTGSSESTLVKMPHCSQLTIIYLYHANTYVITVLLCLGLTLLSTIFQSYHDGYISYHMRRSRGGGDRGSGPSLENHRFYRFRKELTTVGPPPPPRHPPPPTPPRNSWVFTC